MAGRGRARRHAAWARELTNKLHLDYFFSGDDAKTHPVLVCHDELTGNQLARLVEHTGVAGNESVIVDIVEELKVLGHGYNDNAPLVLMTDGEPAIRVLKTRLMQLLPGRNSEEVAAKNQSVPNGRAEEVGK